MKDHIPSIRSEIARVEKTLASIRSAIASLHDAEYANKERLRKLKKALARIESEAG